MTGWKMNPRGTGYRAFRFTRAHHQLTIARQTVNAETVRTQCPRDEDYTFVVFSNLKLNILSDKFKTKVEVLMPSWW